MSKLIVENIGTFEVMNGKRLVNALIDVANIDQLHSCGGVGKCTTCRVQFIEGEPTAMTKKEEELLALRGLDKMPGVRLSCQILCEADMTLKAISRLAGSGKADAGKHPADEIQPPPEWLERSVD